LQNFTKASSKTQCLSDERRKLTDNSSFTYSVIILACGFSQLELGVHLWISGTGRVECGKFFNVSANVIAVFGVNIFAGIQKPYVAEAVGSTWEVEAFLDEQRRRTLRNSESLKDINAEYGNYSGYRNVEKPSEFYMACSRKPKLRIIITVIIIIVSQDGSVVSL
jgi:hypothetical protein